MRYLLTMADAISPRKFLWVDIALSGLITFAHGGALWISLTQPTPDAESIQSLAAVSLPLAGAVAISAVVGLLSRKFQLYALALHGLILAGVAAFAVAWAISLFLKIPDGRFVWSVGILSAYVCYATFVFTRFSLPEKMRSLPLIRFAPLIALILAIAIDLGVFASLLHTSG